MIQGLKWSNIDRLNDFRIFILFNVITYKLNCKLINSKQIAY